MPLECNISNGVLASYSRVHRISLRELPEHGYVDTDGLVRLYAPVH